MNDNNSRKKFGEVLLEIGVLDQRALDQALAIQRGTGRRIGKVLEEMRLISEREIAAVLAKQFGFRTVRNLADRHFSRELLQMIPREMAVKHQVFPVRKKDRELFVAMVNPLDMEALDALSFQLGMRITPCVTIPSEINGAIERHFEGGRSLEAAEEPGRLRILLLEPNDAIRKELSQALCREYEVAEARQPNEALQICRHLKPRALLVSSQLPQSDAVTLLAEIRKAMAVEYLPAIVLAPSATLQDEVSCLEGGFSDYLEVPIHPQRLLVRLAHSLGLKPL